MKYLYYKMYQLLRKVKTNDTPATNAMYLISTCQMINMLTMYALFNHFIFKVIRLRSKDEIFVFAFIFAISIIILNYFILYKKKEEICEKYKNESKLKSRIGYLILIAYCASSAVLVYVIGSKYPI